MEFLNGNCIDSSVNGVKFTNKCLYSNNYFHIYENNVHEIKIIIMQNTSEFTPNILVDDKEIIQISPFENNKIIIDFSNKGDFNKVRSNGIKLICALINKFQIPIENILPLRYFSNEKILNPRQILKSEENWKSNWCFFQFLIMREFEMIYN